MKLNRRSFLKLTSAVLSGLAVPDTTQGNKSSPKAEGYVYECTSVSDSKSEPTWPEFNPEQQIGDFVTITDWNREDMVVAKQQLVKQIKTGVPPEYRCCVSFTKQARPSGDTLLQRYAVGWKYIPEAKSYA